MRENRQDEKTIILPAADNNTRTTINLNGNNQNKKTNTKLLRFVLIILIILAAAGLGGYTLYIHRDQKNLTRALKTAVQKNKIKKAHAILKLIKRRGYSSPVILSLNKQLAVLQILKDKWNMAQRIYNLGMLTEARKALLAFTSNAVYRDKAITFIKLIKQRRLKGILETATTLYAGGNLQQAEELTDYVIKKEPDNPEAKKLLITIELRQTPKHIRKKISMKQKSYNAGDKAYKKGDLSTAIKQWSKAYTEDNAKKIVLAGNINKYFNLGKSAYAQHNYNSAAAYFEKAKRFVVLIHISNSVYIHAISSHLTDIYDTLGKDAFIRQKYRQAGEYFETALKNDHSDKEALYELAVLNDIADKLYKKAYVLSDANKLKACGLFRQALNIAGKKSSVYKKIEERIAICKAGY